MNAANTSQIWITESSPGHQTIFAILGIVVGGALAYGSRHAHGLERLTTNSGFILGLLILAISTLILIVGGKQVITISPIKRYLSIESISRLGIKKREIQFSQISELGLGEIGDREGGSVSYHVVVVLKSGEEIALFIGAFEGVYDRSVMENRRRRLADIVFGQ